jgi:hypothetical protein
MRGYMGSHLSLTVSKVPEIISFMKEKAYFGYQFQRFIPWSLDPDVLILW